MDERISIWSSCLGNGKVLLGVSGLVLILAGGFALFLTFSDSFLPHDIEAIGFTAAELSLIAPNLVKFMFHDRAAFGGVLLTLGALYLWLAAYPLDNGQGWAWAIFAISGAFGFGSFLLYIGYGYLDWWHGSATIFLLIVFLLGLVRAKPARLTSFSFHWLPAKNRVDPRDKANHGMCLLFVYALGLMSAGAVICIVGVTTVFVPQDIDFIQLCAADIDAISADLLGVIAHDRAGFGGALFSTGVTIWLILVNAEPSRSLWQTLFLSGLVGFGCALGIHFYVGYIDFVHLLPGYAGAAIFITAMALTHRSWGQSKQEAAQQ